MSEGLKIEMEMVDSERFNGEALNVIAGAFDGGSCAYEHHLLAFNIVMESDQDDWPSHAEVSEAIRHIDGMTNLFFHYNEGTVTMHYDVLGRSISEVIWSIGHYLKIHCPHEPVKRLEIDMAAGASYFSAGRDSVGWSRLKDRYDI